jgi:hypothetical protein
LRQARKDVEACAAMTPPVSEAVRAEYFALEAALRRPDQWSRYGLDDPSRWYDQYPPAVRVARAWQREPERSRRVLRLMIVGILAQCDRPTRDRTAPFDASYPIYVHDDETPRALRAVPPERLLTGLEDSVLVGLFPAMGPFFRQCQEDVDTIQRLELEMAARHYILEWGSPPGTYGALVGAYIRALPAGLGPDDAVAPSLLGPAR